MAGEGRVRGRRHRRVRCPAGYRCGGGASVTLVLMSSEAGTTGLGACSKHHHHHHPAPMVPARCVCVGAPRGERSSTISAKLEQETALRCCFLSWLEFHEYTFGRKSRECVLSHTTHCSRVRGLAAMYRDNEAVGDAPTAVAGIPPSTATKQHGHARGSVTARNAGPPSIPSPRPCCLMDSQSTLPVIFCRASLASILPPPL